VLERVGSLLKPDGWLFLGSAETTIGIDDRFERVVAGRTSAYRLRSAPKTVTTSAAGKG
jgi:chemotaxis protein methyltransferase CheR